MDNKTGDTKIVKSVLSAIKNKPIREPNAKFKFNLVKLLTPHTTEREKKIDTAYRNSKQWDEDNISTLALNALQNLFFNVIDIVKEHKDGSPYKGCQYCILETYLCSFVNGFLEDKEVLNKEISKLEEQIEGTGMVSKEDHSYKVGLLKDQVNKQKVEIHRLEETLKNRDNLYEEKSRGKEERLRKKIEFEFKCKNSELTD
tara:strand:+ start:242 stop:844 length:603 start_codon:yes stop_codon:yes gene_type:complete